MPTIGLSMIVKNEETIIVNTLKCIIKYLDFISISDTGSTDQTMLVIKNYLDKHNVPYFLSQDDWIDFSHNRNIALKKLYKKVDYILLLDADEHCIILDPNFKSKLSTKDNIFYRVPTKHINNKNISSKKKIISGHLKCQYNGIVHEQIESNENYKSILLSNSLEILHTRPTDSIKSNKYLKLLEKGIKLEPSNYSYQLHYAFHFQQCAEYNKAIKIYSNMLLKLPTSKFQEFSLKFNIIKCKYRNKCTYSEIKEDIKYFEDKNIYEPFYIAMLILIKEKQYKKAFNIGKKFYKRNLKMNIQSFTYFKDLYLGLYDKKVESIKKILDKNTNKDN